MGLPSQLKEAPPALRGKPVTVPTARAGHFDPAEFEDRYENAVVEMLKQKQAGIPVRKGSSGGRAFNCCKSHGCVAAVNSGGAATGGQESQGTGKGQSAGWLKHSPAPHYEVERLFSPASVLPCINKPRNTSANRPTIIQWLMT
jgi:hypothetical protein